MHLTSPWVMVPAGAVVSCALFRVVTGGYNPARQWPFIVVVAVTAAEFAVWSFALHWAVSIHVQMILAKGLPAAVLGDVAAMALANCIFLFALLFALCRGIGWWYAGPRARVQVIGLLIGASLAWALCSVGRSAWGWHADGTSVAIPLMFAVCYVAFRRSLTEPAAEPRVVASPGGEG